ncbi:MAG: 2-dehydropantoate 2-reductase [Steroidobacterales bacterium]
MNVNDLHALKIAVLGAGSIGGWLAASLARSGAAVSLAARGSTLAALRTGGLRVRHGTQESTFRLPAAPASELGPQDVLVLAVKAHDLPAALGDLRALIGSRTTVVAAMNGLPWWFFHNFLGPLENVALESVDPGGRLAALIAPTQVIGAVVHASASRLEPGRIQVKAVDRIILGAPSGHASASLTWLVESLSRAGVRTRESRHIRLDVWAKLWGNMNMGPLSALTRATTGRLLDDPQVHALCLKMMTEMAACGARLGLDCELDPLERIAITRKLGDFRTSMLQDLESGAALEYGPLLGAVVEVAQRLALPAPYCEAVLGLIRQLALSLDAQRSAALAPAV